MGAGDVPLTGGSGLSVDRLGGSPEGGTWGVATGWGAFDGEAFPGMIANSSAPPGFGDGVGESPDPGPLCGREPGACKATEDGAAADAAAATCAITRENSLVRTTTWKKNLMADAVQRLQG